MTDAATRARDAADLIGWLLGFRADAVPLVRSLAADARRLDWLDANKPNVMGGGRVSLFRSDEFGASTAHAVGATFREAIDAAMAAANARALADAFPVPEVPNA